MEAGKKIVITGYVSLDRILDIASPARTGFTSIVTNDDNAQIYFGGCSTNIASALGGLGMPVRPVLRVGRDYESTGFRAHLESFGVLTDAVEKLDEAATSMCYLVEDAAGEHIALFYPGAQDGKHFRPMSDAYFTDAQIGVLTVGSEKDDAEFVRKCKQHNVPLVFGMKADFDCFSHELLSEVLLYSSVIFTNRGEKAEIERRMGLSTIEELHARGRAQVIVTTLGAEGSELVDFTGGTPVRCRIPVCRCDAVVDMTGCGDAYVAGFLYGWMNGESAEKSCRLGSVLASFVPEKRGCCTNLPDRARLMERYMEFEGRKRTHAGT